VMLYSTRIVSRRSF